MAHPSKRKGSEWDRQIVRLARERGLEAERAYASNGRSLGCTDDVDLVIESWRIQAKRRKALPSYLKVPPGCDCTVFREDRGEPLALVPLSTLLGMIEAEARERPGSSTDAE